VERLSIRSLGHVGISTAHFVCEDMHPPSVGRWESGWCIFSLYPICQSADHDKQSKQASSLLRAKRTRRVHTGFPFCSRALSRAKIC